MTEQGQRTWVFTHLIHHVGESEGAIALAVPGEVEAQAAQAGFGQRLRQSRQHKAVLVVA